MKRQVAAVCFSLLFLIGGWISTAQTDDPVQRRARQLHFSSLVLDTHIDTTLRLTRPDWKFSAEHAPMPPEVASQPESQSQEGHADMPRIRKGGLGALFFGIVVRGTVTGPKAVNDALLQIDAVHKLADDLSQQVAFCTTADQVRNAHRQGKIAALIGMEGGHMINNSLAILRMYGKLGVRYITLTHFYNTDWADSSGEQPKHNGLTPFGRSIVEEMNRQGIMVDISHVSDKTFWDTLEASKTPLIASHSSCRAIADHVRNMTDEMIRALAAKGGVIQINYNSPYLDNDRCQYFIRTQQRLRELGEKYPGPENEKRRQDEISREFGPPPRVTWEKIIDHIEHVAKIAGAEHVGLGSDFDGATMPQGMEDVSKLPKITEALLRRGYSQSDIRKILGENTLRVMAEAEQVARQMNPGK